MNMKLRHASSDDENFLFKLFASIRAIEFESIPLPKEQMDTLLKIQFHAQAKQYSEFYPGADNNVILIDDMPAGRLYVDRTSQEIRLVDIAFLPEHQGSGLGTELLHGLVQEADETGLPIRLQVDQTNRAQKLYLRMGFKAIGENDIRIEMEKAPVSAL